VRRTRSFEKAALISESGDRGPHTITRKSIPAPPGGWNGAGKVAHNGAEIEGMGKRHADVKVGGNQITTSQCQYRETGRAPHIHHPSWEDAAQVSSSWEGVTSRRGHQRPRIAPAIYKWSRVVRSYIKEFGNGAIAMTYRGAGKAQDSAAQLSSCGTSAALISINVETLGQREAAGKH
jgi:hypothetical protein